MIIILSYDLFSSLNSCYFNCCSFTIHIRYYYSLHHPPHALFNFPHIKFLQITIAPSSFQFFQIHSSHHQRISTTHISHTIILRSIIYSLILWIRIIFTPHFNCDWKKITKDDEEKEKEKRNVIIHECMSLGRKWYGTEWNNFIYWKWLIKNSFLFS